MLQLFRTAALLHCILRSLRIVFILYLLRVCGRNLITKASAPTRYEYTLLSAAIDFTLGGQS